MSSLTLSPEEEEIVLSAMRAILIGPFISERAFPTRIGASREHLAKLVDSWPEPIESDPDSMDAIVIKSCLNEICHGVRFTESSWENWFTVTRDRVKEVFDRLRESTRQ